MIGDTIRLTRRQLDSGATAVWEGVVVEGNDRGFCLRGRHTASGKPEYGWFDGDTERLLELYGCEQTVEVIGL